MTATQPPITIPAALEPLTKEQRWVGWRWIKGKDGKLTKPPFRADAPHLHASSTDPSTWCNLDVAMGAYCRGEVDGIGFALSGSEIGAEDLDDCRIAESGVLNPWAAEQIQRAGSYAEVTPSKEGVRVIGLASGPPVHRKFNVPNNGGMSCELYRRADRYICITGQQIGNATQLANIDAQIDALHAELDGAKRANGAKQSAKQGKSGKNGKQRDLDALIKDGCGEDFGGDRSRATWYVIHALLKQGRSPDDIVGILIDPANGISAHCLDQSRPGEYARKQVEKAQQESAGGDDTDAEIERLAKLSAIQYEQERKAAAEQLNVRASILDKLVKAKRGDSKEKEPAAALYDHWNVEAASAPVDTAILLHAIKEAARRYVFMSDDQAVAVTLWIPFTWLHEHEDAVTHSPILYVTSAEKDSGKSTLLGVLNFLARRSLQSVDISGPALFRSIAKWQPTLIVDEADDALGDNPDLRSVINSGWTRGQGVIRCHPDTHEPELFSTFAPKIVAMKGRKLPDTTLSRSIVIAMKPRRASDPNEHTADFNHIDNETFTRLRSRLMRWSADNAEALAKATPEIPPGFHNRRRANWVPLLAIAEAGGGDWKKAAWQAALAIEAVADTFDPSIGVELLRAVKAAFEARNIDRITSAGLITDLVADETAPWATWNKGKPISQRQVAGLLKPYGIRPGTIKLKTNPPTPDGTTAKGYLLEWFADVFSRTPSSPQNPDLSVTAVTSLISHDNHPSPAPSPAPAGDGRKTFNNNSVSAVTEKNGSGAVTRHAEGGIGLAPGLSHRSILDLARWYIARADDQRQDEGDVDSIVLDAGLREVLAEQVLPEFVEVEFERVMAEVFRA